MTNTKKAFIFLAILVVAIIIGYSIPPRAAVAPETSDVPVVSNPAPVYTPTGTSIPVSIVSIKETASDKPNVTVEYPQFPSLSAEFNKSIASSVNNRIAEFRQEVEDNNSARTATSRGNATIPMSAFTFIASWTKVQANEKYVSFIIRFSSYVGGANENQEIQTFNYNVATQKPVTLADLFSKDPRYLDMLSKTSREQLNKSLKAAGDGYEGAEMMKPGTEPLLENFMNFTFTEDAITIYFPKYAVAPGAFGEQKVVVPRK